MSADGGNHGEETEQLVLLDAQDLTDLLNGDDVSSKAVTVDEDGDTQYIETKVVNRSGEAPWMDSSSSSRVGWKGHALTLSTMLAVTAFATYVVTRIPFENVFSAEVAGQTPGFAPLFAVMALFVFIVWAMPYLPGKISGRGGV